MFGRHASERFQSTLRRLKLRRDLSFDRLGQGFSRQRSELELFHRGLIGSRRAALDFDDP